MIANSPPNHPTLHSIGSRTSIASQKSLHRDPAIKQGKQRQTSMGPALPMGAKRAQPLAMPGYPTEDGLAMPSYDSALPTPNYDDFGAASPPTTNSRNSRYSSSGGGNDSFGWQEKRRHSSILE